MITLLIITLFGIGFYLYHLAINSKSSKDKVFQNTSVQKEKNEDRIKEEQWFESQHNDIYLTSNHNSLRLHAYEFENTSLDTWVIVVHGYMSDGKGMSYVTKEFFDRGDSVLVPDLRGHGKSEGNYVGMGVPDRFDIVDWIQYLLKDHPNRKIILYGISMGAATAMMAAGGDAPEGVAAVVEDCGYTDAYVMFTAQLKKIFGLPELPIMRCVDIVTRIKTGAWLSDAAPIRELPRLPTLFIHGDADKLTPVEMAKALHEASRAKTKELLIVPGVGHADAKKVAREAYYGTIFSFLEPLMK